MVEQFASWNNKNSILMNTGNGGKSLQIMPHLH